MRWTRRAGKRRSSRKTSRNITVATNSEPILSHIGSITEPDDILGAQFSLPFSVAMRLHHGGEGVKGGNGFWDYTQVDFRDPALLETARKVKVVVAANDKWERVDEGAGLEIETTDGRRIKASVPFSKGLPENPMSPDEVEEKFRYLVEPVMGTEAADAIVAAVAGIESIDDINDLVRLLIAPDAPNARAAAE